ncbi:unnamed protein product [Caenorhabditis angaria]|uniref:RanBD1 domain-containing protein n=1 Tax=Caenorhabditis angaria TaxID=860376 RepID=A0A9P1ICI3_9PELO|nr:unnamed protein product [Caenorhabditis angaria]
MTEPRKFAFKKSALADKADKIWSESKNDFSASKPVVNHVQLEKKSLGDVLGKISAQKPKDNEENPQQSQGQSGEAFVFGSKISERVVKCENKEENNGSTSLTATELFKTAVKKDEEKETNGNAVNNFREQAVQEAERAKEAEKQHASTSVVEVTTGEESDSNIFQASCKIWVFDKERREYTEKGVCTLRINQSCENGQTHHRIVARTSGTLRVVINSKIFSGMLLERPDRRIRISAMTPEASGVQIFLLKFGFSKADTGAEADQFFNKMTDLLKSETNDQTRKRKADCDLNAERIKIKEDEAQEQEQSEKEPETSEV